MIKGNDIGTQLECLLRSNFTTAMNPNESLAYYRQLPQAGKRQEVLTLMLLLASAGHLEPEEACNFIAKVNRDILPADESYAELSASAWAVLQDVMVGVDTDNEVACAMAPSLVNGRQLH